MKIFVSDEKYFDSDGVYNSQHDRVWAVNRADADEKGGVKQRRRHPPLSNDVAGSLLQGHNALSNLE